MLILGLAVIICYLIGSIPFGYIIARTLKNIDIRRYGSGNIGATNILRTINKKAGFTVLILDVLKGFICVSVVAYYFINKVNFSNGEVIFYILGIAAIIGHNWTVFLGFKGGKGVSTTLGVIIGISLYLPTFRLVIIILLGIWILVILISRIVSLASVITALSLPIIFLILSLLKKTSIDALYFASVLSFLIVIKHKHNIRNLINHRERKISF